MITSVHSCHQHKRTLREWHLNSGCYSMHPADCCESWFGSDLSQQTYTLRGIISYLSAVCTANFSRYCHFSEPPAVSLLVPCTFLKLLIIRRLLQTIKPPYGLRRLHQTYSIWYSTKQKEELHSDSSLCEYKRSTAINTILVIFAFSATSFRLNEPSSGTTVQNFTNILFVFSHLTHKQHLTSATLNISPHRNE